MKKIELLAPAGSYESFIAAVDNGADAVYFGGKNFSARAFASNFTREDIRQAVEYAHLRNVKVNITINTLLNDFELDNAMKEVEYYHSIHVDALIIQDLGLYYRIKTQYPDFEIHASTQMHIHNLEGVRTAKKMGFSRVVVARESSIDMIREFAKEDIEIETFIHGAICVSYSGQCLMSSATKGRSANKGACAQCCRLRYTIQDENNESIETDTKYLLSPKDMCLIDDIPLLIEAGVASLKIEGRMKSPAYVAAVTSMYRKAIDAYYENQSFKLTDDDLYRLKVSYNREFTDTYLMDDHKDLFGQKTPNHLGVKLGRVAGHFDGNVLIDLERPVSQFDGIRIGENGTILNFISVKGNYVNHADKGVRIAVPFKDYAPKGETVYLTLDHALEEETKTKPHKHIGICAEISVYLNKPVIISLKEGELNYTYVSDIYAVDALKQPLNKELALKQFSKLNDTPFFIEEFILNTDNRSFLTVKQLNELRRIAIEEFSKYKLNSYYGKEKYSEISFKEVSTEDVDDCIDSLIFDPVINPYCDYKDEICGVSEIGGLLKGRKASYYTMNIYNSWSFEFLNRIGINRILLSTELNDFDISELMKRFKERTSSDLKPYMLIKGRRALMYLKKNPFDKYGNAVILTDKDNSYIINKIENCTEIIESKEYSRELINNIHPFIIKNR